MGGVVASSVFSSVGVPHLEAPLEEPSVALPVSCIAGDHGIGGVGQKFSR